MRITAIRCRESADALREGSKMLVAAADKFDIGKLAEACVELKKADYRMSKI